MTLNYPAILNPEDPMTQELGVPAVEGQGSAQRLFREQDFHNRRFAEDAVDARTDVRRWYVAIREVRAAQVALLRQLGSGKAVLEYGCADGKLSIDELAVPRFVGTLDGIDISDIAIAVAREKARNLGIENTRFQHMDPERMTFPRNSFDVVYGPG